MDEYINRGKLKAAVIADLQTLQTVDEHTLNLAILEIEEAPAADVALVVHGEWLEEPVEFWSEPDYLCSKCKTYAITNSEGRQVRSNFCPYCGAKMDGGSR